MIVSPAHEFAEILTGADLSKPFMDALSVDLRKSIKSLASKLRHVRDDHATKEELVELLEALGIDPFKPARADLKSRVEAVRSEHPEVRRIPVKITTVQSSKGLAADLVCLAYFDDQYVIKNKDNVNVTDQDVCNFLVALTRARKKLLLISSIKQDPSFLGWIDQGRINRI